jgi:molybdopterin converting factor subunit 1
MTLTVLLFARYQELAGGPVLHLDLPDGATLGAVWAEVRRRIPGLAAEGVPLMAVDRAYAQAATIVRSGSEVAFFPPVSGG